MQARPRIVVLRGHHHNVAELRSWELLSDRYDVVVGETGSNRKDVSTMSLERAQVRARRDLLPGGRLGDLAALAVGDRYRGLRRALEGADIVHSAELGVWFSGQPARLKAELGFKLVLTVWETIPFRDTFRAFRGRADRRAALTAADVFLAATERARSGLLLEGVEDERIVVSPPGVDVERFASHSDRSVGDAHVIVSPARLVWEKGHFDVLRALALLDPPTKALLVGSGPEREKLLRYAAELGLADRVDVEAVPYDEMPRVFARASCVVLASLPIRFWEEQFGMVLAEALASGAPIVASSSGAIPEVLSGAAPLFPPGDWVELARLLREGPLAGPPKRVAYDQALVRRYSLEAAADRLAAAYERVLRA